MLSNDAALPETFYSKQSILSGLHPALTIIDCSTVAPATSQRLAEELKAHYVDFLDAPVSGSPILPNCSMISCRRGRLWRAIGAATAAVRF